MVPVIIAVVIIAIIAAFLLVGLPALSKSGLTGSSSSPAQTMSRAFEGDWLIENSANAGSTALFRVSIQQDNSVAASFPDWLGVKINAHLEDGGSSLVGTYSDSDSGESGGFKMVLTDNSHISGTWQVQGHNYTITGQKTTTGAPAGTTSPRTTATTSRVTTTPTASSPVSTVKAGFSADKTSGSVPLTVSFTDTSTGSPDSYYWDFGDGTHSTERNPVHTFTGAGSFTVTLSAGKNGQTSTKSLVVTTASQPLTANFAADKTSGTAPLAVSFTDTSTGSPATWIWQFGNGQVSYERNPEVTYQGQGDYTVLLTVEKDGIQNKKSMVIHVTAAPVAITTTTAVPVTTVVVSEFNNGNIYTVYNNPTKPTTVTFTTSVKINSISDYHWNNGQGDTPGSIALKHSDGTTYGWWTATGSPGQGGVPNAYWTATPGVTVKAGTYTVLDSDPSTWSQNSQSGNAGMTRILYQQA